MRSYEGYEAYYTRKYIQKLYREIHSKNITSFILKKYLDLLSIDIVVSPSWATYVRGLLVSHHIGLGQLGKWNIGLFTERLPLSIRQNNWTHCNSYTISEHPLQHMRWCSQSTQWAFLSPSTQYSADTVLCSEQSII